MIKYHLGCQDGHEFESWFRSIADYDAQLRSAAVQCPLCGSTDVAKQPMAPAVVSKRGNASVSKQVTPENLSDTPTLGVLRALKKVIIENSEDVGTKFADEARKIHFGEAQERNIRGSSTRDEAQALLEDGVSFGILPPLPEDLN
ncbi:DUF1178 family protein [Hyphomicrobium sp.]|jgi:hypothetical protein|uniref:DUF1178 family protein n=1 Tax=Hyphomicrobium sp. TaxID=82 RepID=UPI002CE74685|nr:DUF1178 family protein [Hyphomicrobium sp.]HVZ04814.1 DUF1178 family protein [Hyphomicrobium sp.]